MINRRTREEIEAELDELWRRDDVDVNTRVAIIQAEIGLLNFDVMSMFVRQLEDLRVDNPHTKSLAFWEWLIAELRKEQALDTREGMNVTVDCPRHY